MRLRDTGWERNHSITVTTLVVMGVFANFAFAEDGFAPLFDGRTLNGWITTRSTGSFSVNGKEKAIHVYAGKEHGSEQRPDCLVTKKQFSHYILRLEYKWLENRFSPRIDWDRDAGILFHIHGSLKKLWPNSIEMQLGETPGSASKDYWKGRKLRRFHTGDLFLIQKGAVRAQYKHTNKWWDPNGELHTSEQAGWTRYGIEKPKGEWNEVEIRVLGDQKATFILNGEVVFEIMNMENMEDEQLVPLTKGHIGLQAEWAELLYRNIRIKELNAVDGAGEQAERLEDKPIDEGAGGAGKHLVILSGQSNMNAKVREHDIIKPMVEKEFGKDSVIAVRHAVAGSSIAFWLEKTINAHGDEVSSPGTAYPKWMKSVKAAAKDKEIASVTFIWMQGESDVLLNKKPGWKKDKPMPPEIYRKNFLRLLERIRTDLGVDELNVVIGRLCDFHKNESTKKNKELVDAWVAIRELQVRIAEELPSGAWVDTDDLNDGLQTRRVDKKAKDSAKEAVEVSNDLHYTDKGYEVFSQRLAEAAIKLIRQTMAQAR